eukprot:jgi/Botrbrau1/14323/Bobra.0287s0015.2
MGVSQDVQEQFLRVEGDLLAEREARAAELASHDADMAQLSAKLAAAEDAARGQSAELEARGKVHEEDRTAADRVVQQYKSQLEALLEQRREEEANAAETLTALEAARHELRALARQHEELETETATLRSAVARFQRVVRILRSRSRAEGQDTVVQSLRDRAEDRCDGGQHHTLGGGHLRGHRAGLQTARDQGARPERRLYPYGGARDATGRAWAVRTAQNESGDVAALESSGGQPRRGAGVGQVRHVDGQVARDRDGSDHLTASVSVRATYCGHMPAHAPTAPLHDPCETAVSLPMLPDQAHGASWRPPRPLPDQELCTCAFPVHLPDQACPLHAAPGMSWPNQAPGQLHAASQSQSEVGRRASMFPAKLPNEVQSLHGGPHAASHGGSPPPADAAWYPCKAVRDPVVQSPHFIPAKGAREADPLDAMGRDSWPKEAGGSLHEWLGGRCGETHAVPKANSVAPVTMNPCLAVAAVGGGTKRAGGLERALPSCNARAYGLPSDCHGHTLHLNVLFDASRDFCDTSECEKNTSASA